MNINRMGGFYLLKWIRIWYNLMYVCLNVSKVFCDLNIDCDKWIFYLK